MISMTVTSIRTTNASRALLHGVLLRGQAGVKCTIHRSTRHTLVVRRNSSVVLNVSVYSWATTRRHVDSIRYDTIRDAILTCTRRPT